MPGGSIDGADHGDTLPVLATKHLGRDLLGITCARRMVEWAARTASHELLGS
jgi:hypothetical protein